MNKFCLGLLLVLHYFHAGSAQGCDPRCKGGQGTCLPSGRCLCWWGWTGPHGTYITSGALKNRILADYCTTACHYTHDYRNPLCARIPPPTLCSMPHNKTVPPLPCDPGCGTGIFHSTGKCLSNGRCLCWWGWTGPHACYMNEGAYKNRILADNCNTACHYTPHYRNLNCTRFGPTTLPPSIKPHNSRWPTASSASKANKPHSTSQQSHSNQQKLNKSASTLAAISHPASRQLHATAKRTTQRHITSGKLIATTDTKPSVAQPSMSPAVVNTSNAKPSTTQTATGVQIKHCSTEKSTRIESPTRKQTKTAAIHSSTSAATTATKTEPTEPPEPTEPTEPTEAIMAIRGMPQNVQSELQADEPDMNENEKDSSVNDSDGDPPKRNSTAAVILVVTLLIGVFVIGGVVWWKHGSGNQCSRLLGGYEPVENNEINTETNEFSLSSVFP